MFKILNLANSEEIAIITAVIDCLEKDDTKVEKQLNYWDSSAKKNNCERHSWKSISLTDWQSSSRIY